MKTPNGMIFQDQAGYDDEMARIKRLGLDHKKKQGGNEDPGGVFAFRQSIFSQYGRVSAAQPSATPSMTVESHFAHREKIFRGSAA